MWMPVSCLTQSRWTKKQLCASFWFSMATSQFVYQYE